MPQPYRLQAHAHVPESLAQALREHRSAVRAHSNAVNDQSLQVLGELLWQCLPESCAEELKQAKQAAGTQVLPLLMSSRDAQVQSLPWECLYHPHYGFLAQHKGFSLSRHLPTDTPLQIPAASKGPLKVLLFTSLPDDLDAERGRLDIEQEQANWEAALAPAIDAGTVVFDSLHSGRFASLEQALKNNYHFVCLSGHGSVEQSEQRPNQPATAHFLCEAEDGNSERIAAQRLAAAFDGHASIRCVLLSACESGKAPSEHLHLGLAQALYAIGVPQVLGMRESVYDHAATEFAVTLIDEISKVQALPQALQSARRHIAVLGAGQWSLPQLFSHDIEQALIDWDFSPQPPDIKAWRSEQLEQALIPVAKQFIGRRRELDQLLSSLTNPRAQPHERHWFIRAIGGQGKTALAGKVVSYLEQQQDYLLLAVSARADNPAKALLEQAIQRLDPSYTEQYKTKYEQQTPPPLRDKIQDLLRWLQQQSQRKLLLFIDNLESVQAKSHPHALEDADLALWLQSVQDLGRHTPMLLLTSRWALPDWHGEELPLRSALYGDFIRFAREKKAEFDKDSLPYLRQLHAKLDGNFQGLQFFLDLYPHLNTSEEQAFLAHLDQAQGEIQQYIALELIYQQLSPAAQALLQRLPLLPLPIPLRGFQVLLAEDEDAAALSAELQSFSLLARQDYEGARYYCLPLVADWLEKQGLLAEASAWQRRIALYLLDLLNEQENYQLPQAETTYQALLKAGENESAYGFSLDRIVGAYQRAGRYHSLLDDWLPVLCQSQDNKHRARALGETGTTYHYIGAYEQALSYLEKSLAIFQENGNKAAEGTTLNNISTTYHAKGDYDRALAYLEKSLAIFQENGNKAAEGTTLNNISTTYHAKGDYDRALSYLEKSLAISEEIGDKSGMGTTLNNISQIYDARGDYDRALAYLEKSLAIREEIGDKSGMGTTLNNISQIYDARGDYDRALSYLEKSLVICEQIGDKSGMGTALNNISTTYHAKGDYDRALGYLEKSLAISEQIGDKSGMGTTLNNISQIYDARGDYDRALGYLEKSLVICEQIGDKSGMGTTLNNISQIYDARGDYDRALSYLEKSLAIREQIGDKSGMGATLNNISTAYHAKGDTNRALSYLEKSLAISAEINDVAGLCASLFNIGHLYWQQKKQAEALGAWVQAYELAAPRQLAQALAELDNLAQQLGQDGLNFWAKLAAQRQT